MKKLVFLFALFPVLLAAQDINKLVVDEKSGTPMAVGFCDRTVFADTNFAWWYDSGYNNYEVNTADLDTIKNNIDGVKIKIVFGTWCSDSKREVPRFLKILDELKYDQDSLEMICVNRDKVADSTEVKDLNIEFVPTFIIYRNDNEIGRIIEEPESTLEGDLKKILY